jgi:GTPase involved in cell partitioning and DNA repair
LLNTAAIDAIVDATFTAAVPACVTVKMIIVIHVTHIFFLAAAALDDEGLGVTDLNFFRHVKRNNYIRMVVFEDDICD